MSTTTDTTTGSKCRGSPADTRDPAQLHAATGKDNPGSRASASREPTTTAPHTRRAAGPRRQRPSIADAPGTPRILLAEDDREMRRLLGDMLRDAGYHVLEAHSGHAAVTMLGTLALMSVVPSAIITDVRMPGYDGLQILSGLKGKLADIPVFVITAFGSDEVHNRAERLGATAVFDKPFDIEHLLDAVRRKVPVIPA